MALRILGRTYQTSRYIITDVRPKEIAQPAIAAIRVEICNESSTAIAKVIADNPDSPKRKLRLALTAPAEIERAIAAELNIPLQAVNRLVRYEARDRCSK